MDFGIARAVSDDQATMTQTAQVIGTAQYLSPEQARGERVDARSDLYSTGCLLYELLTGRPPFTGDSPVAIAYQHVPGGPGPAVASIDPEIPPWADAIVLKAMAKDPADRYQSAGEMRDGHPARPCPACRWPRRRDRHLPAHAADGRRDDDGQPDHGAIPAYQYGPDDDDDGGRRAAVTGRWPWILGLLVVLGAVGALAYMLLGSGGKTYAVPLVQGLPVARAQQEVANAHLRSTVVPQASTGVGKGDVISTNPPQGNTVKANTLVTLFVSTGPKAVSVPNVVGQQASVASTTLTNAGLTVKQVADPNSTAPKGQVTKQDPASGSVPPGTQVTISVSGGSVTVPPVIGDSASTAEQILQNAGFNVVPKTVTGAPAGTVPGNVFQQNPSGNSSAAQGATVTIFIAAQPADPEPESDDAERLAVRQPISLSDGRRPAARRRWR